MSSLREFAIVASVAMLGMGAAIGKQRFGGEAFPRAVEAHPSPNTALQPAPADGVEHDEPRAVPALARLVAPSVVQAALRNDNVAERVREIVPRELFGYFDLYLYVSKAAHGPWAQRMYVFDETRNGDLRFEQDFPVSTGREMREKYFTGTPAGLFELDPDRFDRVHFSHRWHNAPMPWAMFLNYTIRGKPTGVALHSAIGHEADLGHRASGGCVRMPPEKAEELFERIQSAETGRVPIFAMDGSTTDKLGRIALNPDGSPRLALGYKVLLIVENYPGAPVVVTTIS